MFDILIFILYNKYRKRGATYVVAVKGKNTSLIAKQRCILVYLLKIIAKAIDKANAIIDIATRAIVSKTIIVNIHSNISTTSFM